MPAKVDRTKWTKQINQLTPELYKAAGKVTLKYSDQAREKLEQKLVDKTGGYRDTIKSGSGNDKKSFFAWVSWGNDENPATPLEQGHIDKKSGKHVLGIRLWYPIAKIINKARRSALKRGYNQILRSIFK
jgi:hypothetical protein